MTNEDIRVKICELVKKSIENNQIQESFTFEVSQKTIDKAWKQHFINLKGYSCQIHSNEIRHIEKEHPDDIEHICEIHYYIERFLTIEKSSNKNNETGKTIPCFVFKKVLDKRKIRIVKLNISRNKILKLKTLFKEL